MNIEEGGAWTLQRLSLETHPVELRCGVEHAAATADSAAVLQQVKIEALNLTVIKGSGQEVLNWATSNNFFLNTETREHLLAYAKGSPIFMAAKYDTSVAKARGLFQGDGTPILITMKTAHIWVPLEVLAIEGQQVQADLYLLTDQPVYTTNLDAMVGQSSVGSEIPGASGFVVSFQEKLTPRLFHDLSTDRNMGWVRSDSWLTYLNLNAPEPTVIYDLGVSPSGVIRLTPYGTPPMAVVDGQVSQEPSAWLPRLPLGAPQVLLAVITLRRNMTVEMSAGRRLLRDCTSYGMVQESLKDASHSLCRADVCWARWLNCVKPDLRRCAGQRKVTVISVPGRSSAVMVE